MDRVPWVLFFGGNPNQLQLVALPGHGSFGTRAQVAQQDAERQKFIVEKARIIDAGVAPSTEQLVKPLTNE